VRLELSELLGIDRRPGLRAVLVESLPQGRRHLIVHHLLKLGTFEHEDLPAVFEEGDRGRGGRVAGHVIPGTIHRVAHSGIQPRCGMNPRRIRHGPR